MSRRALRFSLLLLLLPALAGGQAPAPQAAPAPRTVDLTVGVTAERGELRKPPVAADFTVSEDGTPRRVAGLAPWVTGSSPGPWRLVIYIDRVLAGTRTLRAAAGALAAQTRELAALGTVEVVVAEPEPRVVQGPTRDLYLLDEVLSRLALTEESRDDLRALRRRFRQQPGEDPRDALAAENRLVRRQQERMIAWLAESGPSGSGSLAGAPRALLLISDGYDRQPENFYAIPRPAVSELETVSHDAGRALAGLGWTAVPLPVDFPESAWNPKVRGVPGSDQFPMLLGVKVPEKGDAERRAEAERRQKAEAERLSLLLAPREPLQLLADVTGGELVASPLDLAAALVRLRGRLRLSYEIPAAEPAPAGKVRPLEVRVAGERRVLRAPRWRAEAVPDEVAAVRARQVLDGEEPAGGLPLVAALQAPAVGAVTGGSLEIRLEGGESIEGLSAGPFRLTWAVPAGDSETDVLLQQRLVTLQESPPEEPWTWRIDSVLPPGTERAAVVFEDLGAGGSRWGGTLAGLVTPEAQAESAPLLPAQAPVRLGLPLGPGGKSTELRRKARFQVTLAGAGLEAARIDLLLDGRRVASLEHPPYEAWIDLGRAVKPHRVEAVAFAADGRELGRDLQRINRPDVPAGLRVAIVSPASGPASGPVDVAADVTVPAGSRLERVEFFWNEELAATLYQPPFRARVAVPPGSPVGYLRVAARLDDGTLAEDAVPMNAAELGTRLDVRLVQMFVVVTDRDGRPVRGLSRDEFRIFQDGEPQNLAGFDDAGELPLTIGLAVDSSASMFQKLSGVRRAAQSLLLTGLTAGKDRALLLDYDDEPRLVRETTRDLAGVAGALETLRADGGSGLFQAVAYSLGQMRAVGGRKALVVYSDGIGEGEDFPFSASLKAARESGIPVYLIVTHTEAARTDGKGPRIRSYAERLRKLSEVSGGRTYFVDHDQDLRALYREVLSELRSQYVLSYYPPETSDGEPWREVGVEMTTQGLRARTISGYYGEK